MVQLPSTAAKEYVAACWVSGAGGFLSGGLLPRGTFGRGILSGGSFVRGTCPGAYARSPKFNAYMQRLGFLCQAS